jgi:hypothetical protein
MPELSPSQEIETEYVAWHAPEPPVVIIRRRVVEGVHQDVSEAFAEAPHRGAETGGVLVGWRDGERIWVEDFEPVPCDHRLGPSYSLSEADRVLLDETLAWFRSGAQPGLEVVGIYRSQTLPVTGLCEDDDDLIREHFRENEDLILLIQPSLQGYSLEDFRLRFRGRAEDNFIPVPLPIAEDVDFDGPADQVLGRSAAQWTPETDVDRWPPPRPRLTSETELRSRQRWLWCAAAIVLGVAGGGLGYVSLHDGRPGHPVSVRAEGRPQAGTEVRLPATESRPVASTAVPANAPGAGLGERNGEHPPTFAGPDTAGIRELLDRWSNALRHGNTQAAVQCYAPVVSTYFGAHDVTREAVRQKIRKSSARYGGLDIYRVSGVAINPVSEDQAVVSFRKHWQTAGRRKFAGEEQERMTLVRRQGQWQISSEQEEKLYWERK